MKSVKADKKQALGARNDTYYAAVDASESDVKGDEGSILTPSTKTLRTPASAKMEATASKRCEFHLLMKSPDREQLATALRKGNVEISEPCQHDSKEQISCDGGVKNYGLCEMHLSMVSVEAEVRVEHLAEAKKSSEQTADIHVLGEPLTPAEVNGQFAWLKPWTEEMSQPGTELSEGRQSWYCEWRKVRFSSMQINSFGGRQARNMRDEHFVLSVFVQSYSLDTEHAFVVIPLLGVQHKVSSAILHNDNEYVRGWDSEKLLSCLRGGSTYADGLSDTGESMFLNIPEANLDARIAELEEEDAKDEAFEAPIATPTSTSAFIEGATLKAKDIWRQHA